MPARPLGKLNPWTGVVPTRRSASTWKNHEAERRRLTNEDERDRLDARRGYAYCLLAVAVAQRAVADASFLIYGFYSDWRVPAAAIDAWLGATIVQVIGVLLVIARSPFASGTSVAGLARSTDAALCERSDTE
jgi:hypothetical protein